MGLDAWVYALPSRCRIKPTGVLSGGQGKQKVEVFYWRKHHNLHDWMETLYRKKGGIDVFNCNYVRLELKDLDIIENLIMEGYFCKDVDPDDAHWVFFNDYQFVEKARDHLIRGEKLVYDSWW